MTIPIKKFSLPRTSRRRRSTKSAPNAATHPATPSTAVPQLVPLLDLVADLIARELWKQRNGSNACLEQEVSETHVVAEAQGSPTVVEKYGKRRSVSQFPIKVLSRVPPKSH